MTVTIYTGDCREVLKELPAESVHCCVTSPPYWGLRDYGTAIWEGGDSECDHLGKPMPTRAGFNERYFGRESSDGNKQDALREPFREVCGKCGAHRIDAQLGLEPTPEEYVENLVNVFREVMRVLRDDGVVWLNLGDSYATSQAGNTTWGDGVGSNRHYEDGAIELPKRHIPNNLKPKDLIGVPWRVAFALQSDGWWLRSDVIWHKTNPMPESVTDRPTKSHEHIFLLSKSAKYFYDHVAIMEPSTGQNGAAADFARDTKEDDIPNQGYKRHREKRKSTTDTGMRNKRDVWTIPTKGYKEAHFATFPPDLVEPCIKAGTSEKGCCPSCGTPWERVTEKERYHAQWGGPAKKDHQQGIGQSQSFIRDGKPGCTSVNVSTIGFYPNCPCVTYSDDHYGPNDPGGLETQPLSSIPCTVLDPFAGAGTVGLVADRLERDAILIELNPEYADMAHDRIKMDSPMFAEVIRC